MKADYPGAIVRPSVIEHSRRLRTEGITIHWTVGRELGDLGVLDGPEVDVQFYVAKDGDTYQLVPVDNTAWHGKSDANNWTVGIETEGSGEPWTAAQFNSVVSLTAWLCRKYGIPVVHASPRDDRPETFRGIMGHGDLTKGGVDQNDHSDTVPPGTGWDRFLTAVRSELDPIETRYYYEYPKGKLTWGPYKRKGVRNLRYASTKLAHPTWGLRKFSREERV